MILQQNNAILAVTGMYIKEVVGQNNFFFKYSFIKTIETQIQNIMKSSLNLISNDWISQLL